MRNEDIRNDFQHLRKKGRSYAEIRNIVGISLFSARNMCIYKSRHIAKKGPKPSQDKLL